MKTDSIKTTVEASQKTTDDIKANITGGDSYCYVDIMVYTTKNVGRVTLHHSGKYPISKLFISLRNVNWLYHPSKSQDQDKEEVWNYNLESVEPGMSVDLGEIHAPNSLKELVFSIAYAARNGAWNQHIVFRESFLANMPKPNIPSPPNTYKKINKSVPNETPKYTHVYDMKSIVYRISTDQTPSETKVFYEFSRGSSMEDLRWDNYNMHPSINRGMYIK